MITFKQYLSEADPKLTSMKDNELMDRLEHDCAYFLHEASQQGFLIRGMRKRPAGAKYLQHPHPRDPEFDAVPFWEIETRKNRQPTDTSLKTHEMLDRWFDDHFGLKARSQAVFCSGSSERGVKAAREYGEAYLIFPIGKFKYVWSQNVSDLYGEIAGVQWNKDYENTDNEDGVDPEEALDRFMTGKKYIANRLSDAVRGRNEVMVGCAKYYAFEYKWRPLLEQLLEIA